MEWTDKPTEFGTYLVFSEKTGYLKAVVGIGNTEFEQYLGPIAEPWSLWDENIEIGLHKYKDIWNRLAAT